MLNSPLKRPLVTLLLLYSTMLVFASIDLERSSAAEELHHFELTSGLKDSTDMQPREIIFTVAYPGRVEIYTSWKPRNKKLTVTLYDQERKAIVGKKERSPLHLVYDYDKESFEKTKNLGHSFRVEISQSLFLSISGNVKIVTPDKRDIDEEDHDIIRGPFGTFIEERN